VSSLIFTAVVRLLTPLLLFFSVFLLLTGHHSPGGGFTGGLIAASAFILYATATDPESARHALRVRFSTLIGAGLLLVLVSGVLPLAWSDPFLTGVWLPSGSWMGELGSPLLFDMGVYLVVMGVTLAFVLSLAEE
jgi:multicomponent Na+:H+ antiporter subunit B